jgi:hypothetical protein
MAVVHPLTDKRSMKDGPFERLKYICHRQGRRLMRKEIPPLSTPLTLYQAGLLHRMEDLFEETNRNPVASCDSPRLNRGFVCMYRKINGHHDSIYETFGHFHSLLFR